MNSNENENNSLVDSPSFYINRSQGMISHIKHFLMEYSYYLIISMMFVCTLFQFNQFIKKKKNMRQLVELQKLDEINKTGINKTSIELIYNTEYEFLNNISLYEYAGDWENLKLREPIFDSNEGKTQIYFGKVKNKNLVIEEGSFKTIFILKDGKYVDHYIRGNFTTLFPKDIIEKLSNLQEKEDFEITNYNTSLYLYACAFLSNYTFYNITDANISIIFHNSPKNVQNTFNSLFVSKFSNIDFNISSKNFSATFNGEIYYSDELDLKVRNYSFILTIIAFVEIYYIFSLLVQVNENNQVGLNLDLITIAVSLLYKSFICSAHFYLSITATDDGLSYEYGIPSIVYFFAFSGFELRLLFFSWKARYTELLYSNPAQFKRKLFIFYFSFYILLFFSLISIKTIITHTSTCFILFSSTWIFQIIHSVRMGTRPPMSKSYIILSTLGKLFLPVYLKAYEGNLFELKPSYLKVSLLLSIVFIQVLILLIQKSFGGKAIVPRCWKKLGYNYYRESINVEEHISKNPDCAICLGELTKEPDLEINVEGEKVDENLHPQRSLFEKLIKLFCIGFWISKINYLFNSQNQKKKYMITPCDHVFHTFCLEQWMAQKNECPYCKQKIPPID